MGDTETNAELIRRYAHVKKQHQKAVMSAERCKRGGANRDRKFQFAGTLTFVLIGIESKMRDRGLTTN